MAAEPMEETIVPAATVTVMAQEIITAIMDQGRKEEADSLRRGISFWFIGLLVYLFTGLFV
jgi:hypothetical protein